MEIMKEDIHAEDLLGLVNNDVIADYLNGERYTVIDNDIASINEYLEELGKENDNYTFTKTEDGFTLTYKPWSE